LLGIDKNDGATAPTRTVPRRPQTFGPGWRIGRVRKQVLAFWRRLQKADGRNWKKKNQQWMLEESVRGKWKKKAGSV